MSKNSENNIEDQITEGMILKILLPFRVFLKLDNIQRIVLDTTQGSMGLLPNRLDFTAAIVPGVLNYHIADGTEYYIALDEGIIVKEGKNVFVSVRNAIGGSDLGQLHKLVEKEFLQLDEQEKNFRSTLVRLESGFIRHFIKLQGK